MTRPTSRVIPFTARPQPPAPTEAEFLEAGHAYAERHGVGLDAVADLMRALLNATPRTPCVIVPFLPTTRSPRSQIAAAVDGLLSVLDEMDGDPDLEPDEGREQDDTDLEDTQ
jgi:hypothetical protein